jgi:hypothetical protein
METGHLIIGVIGAFWSGGMIYFARRAKDVPEIVKPFLFTWWIEDEKVNRFIGFLLGIASVIGSIILIIAGLIGQKILPFP